MVINIMKNIYKKFILGFATILAIFGMVGVSYAAMPTMLTMPASSVTQTDATLNGTFNANGTAPIDVRFEYGTTTKLGQSTAYVTKAAANGSYSVNLTGLSPNTTYYFRAMGINADGPDMGTILDFTTAGYSTPSAITTPATNISQTGATLNGTFNGNGLVTDTWFEYGTSSSLASYISTPGVSQSATYGNMSEPLSGLSPKTTYYFRAVARTSGGIKRSSAILSFTTSTSTPPPKDCVINSFYPNLYNVGSGSPVSISWNTTNCTSVNLYPVGYSALNSSGYTVYPYSTTTYSLSASNGSTSDSKSFTVTVGNYNPNCNINYFRSSTYNVRNGEAVYLSWDSDNCSYLTLSPIGYSSDHESRYRVYPSYPSTTYRLTGPNGASDSLTVYVDRNNTCVNCGGNNNSRPSVTTNSVSNVTSGGAVLHGYADGNGSTVTVWFEYGTTPNMNSSTSRNYGGSRTNANGSLGGLLSNTTYYYRLVASNSQGTTYGNIMSFATNRSTVTQNTNTGGVTNRTINNVTNNRTIIEEANASTNTDNQSDQMNGQDSNSNNSSLSASAGSTGFSILPKTFLGWLILVLVILASIILFKKIANTEYHDRGI